MDPHLKRIPSLTTLTTRRLARSNLQDLGRKSHGSLNAQILALGTLDQLLADLLERLHLAGGEGDANLVDFLRILSVGAVAVEGILGGRAYGTLAKVLFRLLVRHLGGWGGRGVSARQDLNGCSVK